MNFCKNVPNINLRPAVAFSLLVLLGLAGNYFSVKFFFGVNLIFGSIAVLVIIQLYGVFWGTLASIIVSSYTFILWQHPYTIILFTFEALVIGILKKKTSKNIVVLDAVYWIFIGIPLIWLFYKKILGLNSTQVQLIMMKDTVNGIFNVMVCNLALNWLPLRKWIFCSKKPVPIRLKEIIFNLVFACVLVPSLCITIVNSYTKYNNMIKEVRSEISSEYSKISSLINTWYQLRFKALSELSGQITLFDIKSPAGLQSDIEMLKRSYADFQAIYIADSEGTAIAFYPEANERGEPTIGLNFSDRDYYKDLKKTLKPVISTVFVENDGASSPTAALNVPIIIESQFQGYISAALSLMDISNLIRLNSEAENISITIIDTNSKVVATTHEDLSYMEDFATHMESVKHLGDSFYYRLTSLKNELSLMGKWENAFFILEKNMGDAIPWKLIIEQPILGHQIKLQKYSIQSFAIILLLMGLSFLFAVLVSRLLSNSFSKLAQVTTHLPSKLVKNEKINWPNGRIIEICLLVNNFKTTLYTLKKMYEKIHAANIKLEHVAEHDPLTGLSNRTLFKKNLYSALDNAFNQKKMVGIMFLDLDRFKYVNDTMGHAFGDRMLTLTAKRLSVCLKENVTLYRQGGDEFTLIIPGLSDTKELEEIAKKILEVMQNPFIINGYKFHITCSIGITVFPTDGSNLQTLLRNADTAMYKVKESGKNNYLFYDCTMNSSYYERYKLENLLYNALEKNEFHIYYQPKINTKNHEIVGVEALLRWTNPELGSVSPSKFIPLAEETGLIIPIGDWVFYNACMQNKIWQASGYKPMRVSVNISALQFRQSDFTEKVVQILNKTGLKPEWLELEITESTLMKKTGYTLAILDRLKAMNIKTSLDDFGIGFSSLSYLKKFKIDTLKIDSSFVNGIGNCINDEAIIKAIIFIAKNLEINVIAEGVETKAQLAFLKDLDCEEIQGYLFSKPLAAEEMEILIKNPDINNTEH